jgi:hypothetical protein
VSFDKPRDSTDAKPTTMIHADWLEKLVEGDEGFVMTPDVAARHEEARKAVVAARVARAQAKAVPFTVGDRVRHTTGGGIGTLIERKSDDEGKWILRPDKNSERRLVVEAKYFEKPVEGDEGFVPPPVR